MADRTAFLGGRFSARLSCALAVFAFVASQAKAQLPCRYEVTVLPQNTCFGSAANPVAINNLGHVVLSGSNCSTSYDVGYFWDGGPTLSLIPRPPGMLGFHPNDINDHDVIVGEAWYASPSGLRAAIYDVRSGQWTILPPLNPPSGWSAALAINNRNEVVGYRSIGSREDPVNPQTAYFWSARGGFTDLGLIDGKSTMARSLNQAGQMAVGIGPQGLTASVLWDRRIVLPQIPEPGFTIAVATRLNSAGQMAGFMRMDQGVWTSQPFIWANGVNTLLGTLPGYNRGGVTCINDQSIVIGQLSTSASSSDRRAFIWDGVMHDLTTMVSPPFVIRLPYRVLNDGRILATALVNGDTATVILTPLPREPGDTNCDSRVDWEDLRALLTDWGPCASCTTDLTGDASVDTDDLLALLGYWNP